MIRESGTDVASVPVILAAGVIVSQLISNVPFVALYLPLLNHVGASQAGHMALVAGSTIAGNLFILEFARVGVPLTVINVLVYWAFLG